MFLTLSDTPIADQNRYLKIYVIGFRKNLSIQVGKIVSGHKSERKVDRQAWKRIGVAEVWTMTKENSQERRISISSKGQMRTILNYHSRRNTDFETIEENCETAKFADLSTYLRQQTAAIPTAKPARKQLINL